MVVGVGVVVRVGVGVIDKVVVCGNNSGGCDSNSGGCDRKSRGGCGR